MKLLARLTAYFAPVQFNAREKRQEQLSETNRLASALLLAEERAYWHAYMRKACCHGDMEYGMDRLQELDRMERVHG